MAVDTAKVTRTHEFTQTVDRPDGLRVHHYRWLIGDHHGEETALTRIEPVSRATIEDRWEGLMESPHGGDPSKLHHQLTTALFKIAAGLTRRDMWVPEETVVEGKLSSADMVLELDELEATIREWLVSRASKPGVSL